jgi:hypothetical protein
MLHIFDRACNLINEHREILSIVTPQIGNGPFNLVIEDEFLFSEHLDIESQVSLKEYQIKVGSLSISAANATLWNPRPDWEMLHSERENVSGQLTKLPITNSSSPIIQFSNSLANADLPSSLTAAHKLAGLGVGLTPAGDDFLMGAMHAAWIIHPPKTALQLTTAIAETSAPLTTSLSAAWIKSAGRGEAGELWHRFFGALANGNGMNIQDSYEKILSVGETSGADALSGFISTMDYWAKRLTI